MELFIDIYPGVIIYRCDGRYGSEPLHPYGQPRRTRNATLAVVRRLFPDAAARITDHTQPPAAPKIVVKRAPNGGELYGFYREDGSKLFSWRPGDDPLTLVTNIGKVAGFETVYAGEIASYEEYERDWC